MSRRLALVSDEAARLRVEREELSYQLRRMREVLESKLAGSVSAAWPHQQTARQAAIGEGAQQADAAALAALRERLSAAERDAEAAARRAQAERARADGAEARGEGLRQERDEALAELARAREAAAAIKRGQGAAALQGSMGNGSQGQQAAWQEELRALSQQLLAAEAAAAAARAAADAERGAAARELEGERRALLEARRLLEAAAVGAPTAAPGPVASPVKTAPWSPSVLIASPPAGGVEAAQLDAAAAGGSGSPSPDHASGMGGAAPTQEAAPTAQPAAPQEPQTPPSPHQPPPGPAPAHAPAPAPARSQAPQPGARGASPLPPGVEPSFGARSSMGGSVAGGRIPPEAVAAIRALASELSAAPAEELRAQLVGGGAKG